MSLNVFIFISVSLFCQKTACIQPHLQTTWDLTQYWCATFLTPYALNTSASGSTVRCDNMPSVLLQYSRLQFWHWLLYLIARSHLHFHDRDAREWDECRRRQWQDLFVLQWENCREWLLQRSDSLQSCPRLQGNCVYCAYVYFVAASTPKTTVIKTTTVVPLDFPFFCFIMNFDCYILVPINVKSMVFSCAHRGISEVRRSCIENGHLSWRPEWTVQCLSLSCLTLFGTLTTGVTPSSAGRTACSTPSSHHSRASEFWNMFGFLGRILEEFYSLMFCSRALVFFSGPRQTCLQYARTAFPTSAECLQRESTWPPSL